MNDAVTRWQAPAHHDAVDETPIEIGRPLRVADLTGQRGAE